MRAIGFEPTRVYPPEPKSGASANSATLAEEIQKSKLLSLLFIVTGLSLRDLFDTLLGIGWKMWSYESNLIQSPNPPRSYCLVLADCCFAENAVKHKEVLSAK